MKTFFTFFTALLFPFAITAQQLNWATQQDSKAPWAYAGMCTDASGNTCWVGTTYDTSVVQGNMLKLSNEAELMTVCRYDAKGNLLWRHLFDGTSTVEARAVSCDSKGDLYITGQLSGMADFNPDPVQTFWVEGRGYDVFVLKLSREGKFVWAKTFGIGGGRGDAIAADSLGNCYVTGYFYGTSNITRNEQHPLWLASAGEADAFVLCLDRSGKVKWGQSFGGTKNDGGNQLVLTKDRVFISGTFYGEVDFDSGPGTMKRVASSKGSVWLLALNLSGKSLWVQSLDYPNKQSPPVMTADRSGNLTLALLFSGEADLDPGPDTFLVSTSGKELRTVLCHFDANGDFHWGVVAANSADAMCTDAAGNVYFAGVFTDPTKGETGHSISALHADGSFLWTMNYDAPASTSVLSMAADAQGNLYTSGRFAGNVDLDYGPQEHRLTANGYSLYLLQFVPAGGK